MGTQTNGQEDILITINDETGTKEIKDTPSLTSDETGTKEEKETVRERRYKLIKLKRKYKKLENLHNISRMRLIIVGIFCILALGNGILLYTMKDQIPNTKGIISTSIFGTGSIGALISGLMSLKNFFSGNKVVDEECDDKTAQDSINNEKKGVDDAIRFIKGLIINIRYMLLCRTIILCLMALCFLILSITSAVFLTQSLNIHLNFKTNSTDIHYDGTENKPNSTNITYNGTENKPNSTDINYNSTGNNNLDSNSSNSLFFEWTIIIFIIFSCICIWGTFATLFCFEYIIPLIENKTEDETENISEKKSDENFSLTIPLTQIVNDAGKEFKQPLLNILVKIFLWITFFNISFIGMISQDKKDEKHFFCLLRITVNKQEKDKIDAILFGLSANLDKKVPHKKYPRKPLLITLVPHVIRSIRSNPQQN
ncbi:hypothetical protein C2G38_2281090 [Gigaspora rosea]|uniref:Uncharacterized protein n=1 Tax=Gigaspora rosea TaxID=44941 RepID=A0A397VQM1_9GLOM|nr:hypothetical protein C2G38_2281090 [Gigaspora rosea]CAG8472052.1 3308_t:CDS:2 [Gigaspora rosea]